MCGIAQDYYIHRVTTCEQRRHRVKKLLRLYPKWWEAGALLCVGVLPALLLSLLLGGQRGSVYFSSQELKDWQHPAVEVAQLPSQDSVVPVEIIRAKAHFKSPNEIDDDRKSTRLNSSHQLISYAV